jgi:hypothetical protein
MTGQGAVAGMKFGVGYGAVRVKDDIGYVAKQISRLEVFWDAFHLDYLR